MSNSFKNDFQRSFVPTNALSKTVSFDEEMMHVHLVDGRIISVPLIWFPRLDRATAKQRSNFEIGGVGISLHWPDIDEDLSVANLMAGADFQSS